MPADPAKGKRLLILAGLAPKRAPGEDDEPSPDDDKPDDDGPAPSDDAVQAASDAIDALKAGDAEAFARAVLKIKAEDSAEG